MSPFASMSPFSSLPRSVLPGERAIGYLVLVDTWTLGFSDFLAAGNKVAVNILGPVSSMDLHAHTPLTWSGASGQRAGTHLALAGRRRYCSFPAENPVGKTQELPLQPVLAHGRDVTCPARAVLVRVQ